MYTVYRSFANYTVRTNSCTNEEASNYNLCVIEDGSCQYYYPIVNWFAHGFDCNGNCLND